MATLQADELTQGWDAILTKGSRCFEEHDWMIAGKSARAKHGDHLATIVMRSRSARVSAPLGSESSSRMEK
jgi:hypothetical protein